MLTVHRFIQVLVLCWIMAAPLSAHSTGARKEERSDSFSGSMSPIPEHVAQIMRGSSWKEGCPVPLDDLAYLRVSHWDATQRVREGVLIVHRDVAEEVLAIFRHLFEAGFPITRMRLVDEYEADDDRSMADDNTSAFNCRPVTGRTDKFSVHSYGRAIDINPKRNPYVKGSTVLPANGRAFVDRSRALPGMIREGGPVYVAFKERGWTWGGDWRSLKDYQHFQKPTPKPDLKDADQ